MRYQQQAKDENANTAKSAHASPIHGSKSSPDSRYSARAGPRHPERELLKLWGWRAPVLKAATSQSPRGAILRHESFCFQMLIERAPLNPERNTFRGA